MVRAPAVEAAIATFAFALAFATTFAFATLATPTRRNWSATGSGNVRGLGLAAGCRNVVLHRVTLRQAAEALTVKLTLVNEEILAAVRRLDETEALVGKPLLASASVCHYL